MPTKNELAKAAAKTALAIKSSRQSESAKDSAFDFLLSSVKKLGIAALSVALSFAPIAAQSVTKDATGNYHQVAHKAAEPLRTNNTFTTAKGEVFIVWTGERGSRFIVRTSKKTGKTYRQYLPK